MKQNTSHVMMVEPVAFHYNPQTAESNAFMHTQESSVNYQAKALHEFKGLVQLLKKNGVTVNVFKDTLENDTPDSVFPNNWISTHSDGRMVLYPMQAPNRRKERRPDIIEGVWDTYNFVRKIDLSSLESQGEYLESTGSLILDRVNKIAYCALSDRAHLNALEMWKTVFCDYQLVTFKSFDKNQQEIYHTNVMMCIADKYAIVCLESILSHEERKLVVDSIQKTNKDIIEITLNQVYQFAGNMLELTNKQNEKLLVMSQSAFFSLNKDQKDKIGQFAKIIYADVSHIERIAGGSVRCMICEIFPPSQT